MAHSDSFTLAILAGTPDSPAHLRQNRPSWAAVSNPVARARFAREVAAVRKVAPFCTAGVIDARLYGDEPFVVTEFIDGPSLQAV